MYYTVTVDGIKHVSFAAVVQQVTLRNMHFRNTLSEILVNNSFHNTYNQRIK